VDSPGSGRRALIGLLARTNGRAALRRALPTYLGIFVVAVILFTGNGVRSRDVVALAVGSPPTRIGLLAAWLLLALPAARALVATPSTFLIRAWPIPRAQILAVTTAMLALVELPWALLWFKGGGPLWGAAATVIAIGGHGLLLARPRTAAEVGGGLLWTLAIAALAWPALALIAGAPALLLGVRRAYLAAPERIGVARTLPLVGHTRWSAIALAEMHLAAILRGQRPALARAIWFAAGGSLAAGLGATNNAIIDPARVRAIWRVAAALTVGWGAAGLVGGVQRLERQSRWLLDVCAVSPAARRMGSGIALTALGAVLGTATGAALGGAFLGGQAWATAATGATAGGAGAAAAGACGRWACRDDGHDGARLMFSFLVAGLLIAALAFFLSGGALLVVTAGALALPLPPPAATRRGAGGPATLGGEV
jgi:hypothetical protein